MPIGKYVELEDAPPEVRAVYDDIMATRNVKWINNFWKTMAQHPPTLKRIWESMKAVMAPGALDPLTKELIYIAVSVTNGCEYCINSHIASARAQGATVEMLAELFAVTGMANQTNALVEAWRVEVDDGIRKVARDGPKQPA
jgi:AhpD family alkylhydroperoxidase